MNIMELTTEQQWKEAYPVMNELRTHLTEEDYLQLVRDMVPQGYRMFALYDNGKIVALTGIIQLVNFYNMKHIYVYDLITKESERSRGYGEKLLFYIHQLARDLGCHSVALSSGLQRLDAHRFYEEKMGYRKASYSFLYNLR